MSAFPHQRYTVVSFLVLNLRRVGRNNRYVSSHLRLKKLLREIKSIMALSNERSSQIIVTYFEEF